MRTVKARVAALAAAALTLAGCTGGDEAGPAPPGVGPASSASATRDPAGVVSAARDATSAGESVVVGRTTQDGDDWTQEDIEVAFTAPPSARVLHVGEEIWALVVVDGVGYLKDHSERKSTNRWARLSDVDTAARLTRITPAGLLTVLGAATAVASPTQETVRDVSSTCHAFVLDPAKALAAAAEGPEGSPDASSRAKASARLCVDAEQRPVVLVVTIGERVTTSVFSQWGFAIEAMPPPDSLVDQPAG